MNEKDLLWSDVMDSASPECDAEVLDSTDSLYILYTSGTESCGPYLVVTLFDCVILEVSRPTY